MNIRPFIATSMLIFALAPSLSYAATTKMTAAQRCTAFEKQFDDAIDTHSSSGKVAEARQLRTAGGKLCANKKYASGISKLNAALKDIGVQPEQI